MSDYTQTTDFSVKDGLTVSDPNKIIKGAELDTEFEAIATAVNSKYDSSDLATQAQAEAGANNSKLMTPLRTAQAIANSTAATAIVSAVKTANTTVNNSTTLTDDDHIASMSLEASTRYYVTGILRAAVKASSDMKVHIDFSSAPSYAFFTFGMAAESGATAAGDHQADETDTAVITTDTNTESLIIVSGSVLTGATAPTVKLQFAQNAAVVENLILRQGSFLTFAKLD